MKPALTCLSIFLLASLMNGCDPVLPMDVSTPMATEGSPQAVSSFTATPRPLATVDTAQCVEQACILDGHFLLQNPIPADANQVVDGTYRFGSTQEGARDIHHGVEFGNPTGTPVLAAADGEVVHAGDDALVILGVTQNFYGNVVVIEHHLTGIGQTVFTLYAHLSEVSVAAGDSVTAGQQIGLVGSSGSAVGSHLHFEVRLGENTYQAAVNPELWLTPASGIGGINDGALAGIILDKQGEPQRLTNIQLEYSPVEGGVAEKHYALPTYFDTSVSADPEFHENFAISALVPGWYRVVTIVNGAYSSKWVLVVSGKLTFLTISFQ
jgi:hypothetical protein